MIELPKSYRMHVLALKRVTLNSSYGLSKIAIKIGEIPWIIAHGAKEKMVNLALSKVLDLNIPCRRAP